MSSRRIATVLVIATIIGLSAYFGYRHIMTAPLPCSAGLWEYKQWDDHAHIRHRIADYLVDRKLLQGKSREEIEAQLGSPTNTQHFSNWDMVYILGSERGWLSIDSEWLVLNLDETGHVTDYRIVRD